jgi:hypothetical protein
MNQTDARRLILKLWKEWEPKSQPPTYWDRHNFYLWLEREKSELLTFRVSAGQGDDKWQTVSTWLIEDEGTR